MKKYIIAASAVVVIATASFSFIAQADDHHEKQYKESYRGINGEYYYNGNGENDNFKKLEEIEKYGGFEKTQKNYYKDARGENKDFNDHNYDNLKKENKEDYKDYDDDGRYYEGYRDYHDDDDRYYDGNRDYHDDDDHYYDGYRDYDDDDRYYKGYRDHHDDDDDYYYDQQPNVVVPKEYWYKWTRSSKEASEMEQLPITVSKTLALKVNNEQPIEVLVIPKESQLLVPIEQTAKYLDAEVTVYPKSEIIEIKKGNKSLIVKNGTTVIYENMRKTPMQVGVIKNKGTYYMPLSVLANGLGYDVNPTFSNNQIGLERIVQL